MDRQDPIQCIEIPTSSQEEKEELKKVLRRKFGLRPDDLVIVDRSDVPESLKNHLQCIPAPETGPQSIGVPLRMPP